MSKAFMKSIYTTSSDPPSFTICVHSSNTFSNCSLVERPPIKPNCYVFFSNFFLDNKSIRGTIHKEHLVCKCFIDVVLLFFLTATHENDKIVNFRPCA